MSLRFRAKLIRDSTSNFFTLQTSLLILIQWNIFVKYINKSCYIGDKPLPASLLTIYRTVPKISYQNQNSYKVKEINSYGNTYIIWLVCRLGCKAERLLLVKITNCAMASPLQPRNNGAPIAKFWDAPETITALEHVKGWLSKNCKKVR